jgi:serine/threonine protein kinase/tetratricopeptide (TPR) repeat protein
MALTPEQWENVKTLFEAALEKAPPQRAAFLAAAGTQDPDVRQEVERLLASHGEAGDFLSSPPLANAYAPPPQVQAFSSGNLLAGRFRIVRFLARGGMGEVYEAEDVELRERVAMKTIRPELVQDSRALERFKREVHLAKKVTHPNVCRIFDLFRHPALSTEESSASLVFVTMELLEGETLAQRLQRQSRLTPQEALPIALQMSAGLAAAHEAGVLHRDFKPGNVVLAPSAKGTRAVITDFGLALRSKSDSSLSGAVTETGESLGTPAYMSPEQVEGKELSPASDVYSLGLVMYQMVTGKRLFEDTTPLSMAVRRLREDPIPPRNLVPELDARWEAVILRCLPRDPKLRWQNADEVASALKGEVEVTSVKPRGKRSIPYAAAALVLVLLAGLVTPAAYRRWRQRSDTRLPQNGMVRVRRSVAVLPFRNLSSRQDTEWVSTALSDMLTTELATGEKLRTVAGENVARASADLALAGKETLATDTLRRLRQYLGSDFVVLGSYLDMGSAGEGQIRIDLRLQNADSGDIVATISRKGNERQLDELATLAGADLRQRLGVGEVTPSEAMLVRASLPSTPEAIRLYSEGVAKLRLLDARSARSLLERAAAADPKYALAHSALADAWNLQGYDEKAKQEAKRALDLSAGLSREERLWIEGRYWELNRNWKKAVEMYRSLFEFFPDNIEYGLRLANAQKHARTVDEALGTLAALKQLPPPDRDDPRIDLERADVLDVKGAYPEQQTAAAAAVNRARTLGAKLLLARALNQTARSLEKQGKLGEAVSAAEESIQISTAAGERSETAKALTIIGIVRFDQGNFSEAAKVYQQALDIQRETGSERDAATTLNDLGNVLGEQGDLSASIKMLRESLAMFREVGDQHSVAAVLNGIGARTLQQGDLPQARKMLREALTASQEIGDQERTATAVYNTGEVLRFQGDLEGARKMYERALEMSKAIGDQSGVAYAVVGVGDVLAAQGNLAGARQKYNDALALRNQIGETGTAAETRLSLALLALDEGQAAEAERVAREVRENFQKAGSTDDEILAGMALASSLLAQAKPEEARKEAQTARNLLAKSQDFSVKLRAAMVMAEVETATGNMQDARKQLEAVIADATRHGYTGNQLEARLALGESELTSGSVAAGQARLDQVAKDADAKGYGLISRRAKAAAKR